MAIKLRERTPPGPWLRRFLRLPLALYGVGLGPLLGSRLLLLHHTGAKTGLPRSTVLEVVYHDPRSGTYYVAVGFGARSHWYMNLQHHPEARIQIGNRMLDVKARMLSPEQGGKLMVRYATAHPMAARALARFMGYRVDGSDSDYTDLARLGLQFVALQPLAAAPTRERDPTLA